MNLLLDVGNSRLKWRLEGPRAVGGTVPFDANWLNTLSLQWASVERPARVICVSVQSEGVEQTLENLVTTQWHTDVEWVASSPSCCGIRNGYTLPRQLGADRFIALVGARALTEEAVLVIDCGTAVTIDLLDKSGLHRGGWIIPGFSVMKSSVSAAAVALRHTAFPADRNEEKLHFGIDTQTGIAEGVRAAVAGAVSKAIGVATDVLGETPGCLITGGDGRAIASALDGSRHVPDLVFVGLARYAEESLSK